MTAPQLSPGLEWWWTGAEWVPAASHPDGLAALEEITAHDPKPTTPGVPGLMPDLSRRVVPAPKRTLQPLPPVPRTVVEDGAAPALTAAEIEANPEFLVLRLPDPAPAAETPLVPTVEPVVPTSFTVVPTPNVPPPTVSPEVAGPPAPRRTPPLKLIVGGLAGVAALGLGATVGLPMLLGNGAETPAATGAQNVVADAAELDARAAVDAQALYHQQHGTYAMLPALRTAGFRPSSGVAVTVLRATTRGYCLRFQQKGTTRWYDSATQQFGPKACR